MFQSHKKVHKHLELFRGHLWFGVHIVITLDFLQEIWTEGRIKNKKVLAKCGIMVLFGLIHCLLHMLLELDGKVFVPLREFFILWFDDILHYMWETMDKWRNMNKVNNKKQKKSYKRKWGMCWIMCTLYM